MASSAENNVRNYEIAPDQNTINHFNNLANFAKNMTLKDSKLYDAAETDASRWFGNMLVKYYTIGLTEKEANDIIDFTREYNRNLGELLDGDKKIETILKCLGMYKDQDYNGSLLKKVVDSYISDNPETTYSNEEITYFFLDEILDKIYNIKKSDFIQHIQFVSKDETSSLNESSEPNEIDIDELLNIKRAEEVESTEETNENEEVEYDESVLKNSILTLIDKEFFHVKNLDDSTEKKLIASLEEKNNAANGCPTLFFHLSFGDSSETKPLYKSIIILYKELNPEYRKILFEEDKEIAISHYYQLSEGDSDSLIKHIWDDVAKEIGDEKSITTNISNYIRNDSTISNKNSFIFRDYTINGVIYTTKLAKYVYGNPYLARLANESDLITYFIGDDYISNSYGFYQYEKEEIYNFLAIYKETRDYYYKVLLNESFINNKEYSLYEKTFLIFWALERAVSGKIKELKNISSFNKEDIQNFLESFGLDSLSEVLKNYNFYLGEVFGKRILDNYIELVQNKGSREVINTLLKIFNVGDTTLDIKRVFLINSLNSSSEENFSFVRLPYNESSNILHQISVNKSKEVSISEFTSEDKYWFSADPVVLKNAKIQHVQTKYIIPEMETDIYKSYLKSHICIKILETIFENQYKKIEDNSTTIDSDIYKLIKSLKQLLQVYYKNTQEILNQLEKSSNNSSSLRTISINTTYLEDNYGNDSVYTNSINKLKTNGILFDNGSKKIATVINYLLPILLINKDPSDSNSSNNYKDLVDFVNRTGSYKFLNDNKLQQNHIDTIINSVMNFIDFLLSDESILEINKNTAGFQGNQILELENLFLSTFFSDEENIDFATDELESSYSIEVSNDSFSGVITASSKPDDVITAILSICTKLSEYTEQTIDLHVADNEKATLEFLVNAISEFISYTSEIKDAKFNKAINNNLEAVNPLDYVEIKMTNYQADSYFYDDALEGREIEETEEENG